MAPTNPYRHPLGRTCRRALPLALLLMPYALARYGIDSWRERRR
jgi:hypothetical protein